MATFDIVIDDLKVRINHTNNTDQRSFPRNGYRVEKRNDKILVVERGTGQQAFRIDSAEEVNSITDNRTTAGATTPISTIQEIFDIIDAEATPFFFRESVAGGPGGGTTDFILADGTINPASLDGSGNVIAVTGLPNAIGFNSVTPDRDDAVFLQEGRFSAFDGAGSALLTQVGTDFALTDAYTFDGGASWTPGWYFSNDVQGAATGSSDFSEEWFGLEDGFVGFGNPSGNLYMGSATVIENFGDGDILLRQEGNPGTGARKEIRLHRTNAGINLRNFGHDSQINMSYLLEFGTTSGAGTGNGSIHMGFDPLNEEYTARDLEILKPGTGFVGKVGFGNNTKYPVALSHQGGVTFTNANPRNVVVLSGSNQFVDRNNAVYLPEARFNSDFRDEIITDRDNPDLHIFSNYHANATDDYYTNPSDFTTIVGASELNDGLGIYPLNYKGQIRDATDGFNEQYEWVSNNAIFDYGVERFMSIDEGANPNAQMYDFASGVDASGNDWGSGYFKSQAATQYTRSGTNAGGAYDTGLYFTPDTTTILRNVVDSLGYDISFIMAMNDNERMSFVRREDDGVEELEQDFGFYGTSSTFGERTSRFFHRAAGGTVSQVFIQDNLLKLQYRDTDIFEVLNTGNTIRTFAGDTTVNNDVTDGLLAYSINPATTASWGARSIPDKAYVDTTASTLVEVNNNIVSGVLGAWTTVPTGFTNTVLEVLVERGAGGGTQQGGIRAVGSSRGTSAFTNNSLVSIQVKSDSNGDIQIYQGNGSFTFTILSRLN